MIITILNDLETGETDAVIVSETSSSEEIQTCINNAKAEKEYEWQFDDLVNSLPGDCVIYTKWAGLELNKITY